MMFIVLRVEGKGPSAREGQVKSDSRFPISDFRKKRKGRRAQGKIWYFGLSLITFLHYLLKCFNGFFVIYFRVSFKDSFEDFFIGA